MSETGYKRLPCKLDASEKSARADELARELFRRGELIIAKKETAQSSAREIKELDKRIADLVSAVNTGIEQRDVEVRREVRGTMMVTVRVDTWDDVSSRPLDDDERQTALPVDLGERRARKGRKPTDDDKPTDDN